MSESFAFERVEGRYGGFVVVGKRTTRAGVRRVEIDLRLEVVLELAARWRLCPSAFGSHTTWHRDHPSAGLCEKRDTEEVDRKLVEKLLPISKVPAYPKKPEKPSRGSR